MRSSNFLLSIVTLTLLAAPALAAPMAIGAPAGKDGMQLIAVYEEETKGGTTVHLAVEAKDAKGAPIPGLTMDYRVVALTGNGFEKKGTLEFNGRGYATTVIMPFPASYRLFCTVTDKNHKDTAPFVTSWPFAYPFKTKEELAADKLAEEKQVSDKKAAFDRQAAIDHQAAQERDKKQSEEDNQRRAQFAKDHPRNGQPGSHPFVGGGSGAGNSGTPGAAGAPDTHPPGTPGAHPSGPFGHPPGQPGATPADGTHPPDGRPHNGDRFHRPGQPGTPDAASPGAAPATPPATPDGTAPAATPASPDAAAPAADAAAPDAAKKERKKPSFLDNFTK